MTADEGARGMRTPSRMQYPLEDTGLLSYGIGKNHSHLVYPQSRQVIHPSWCIRDPAHLTHLSPVVVDMARFSVSEDLNSPSCSVRTDLSIA